MTTTKTVKSTSRDHERARPEPRTTPREAGRHRDVAGLSATRLELPVVGTVNLPPRDLLIFVGGVGMLAVVGLIDWPVAAVVGVGHLLAAKRSNRVVRTIGEAMEQA
jgi:hypothetical protein